MEKYDGYVGAPYNFVEINKKVRKPENNKIQPHDVIEKGKLSGVIEYEITAKTPIIVDDGSGHFYKNIYGETAIPGSTVRGLVRSNMQILSASSVAADIQDGRLMYRNVANGKNKDRYNDILGNKTIQYSLKDGKKGQLSVLENVKAGYIRNEGGKYRIFGTVKDGTAIKKGDMNYYVKSERKILEDREKEKKFGFLINHKPYILQNNNAQFKKRNDRNGRVHYEGDENKYYHPYYMPISYSIEGEKTVSAINDKGILDLNGYLVSTGMMREKKAVYIIPEIDEAEDKAIDITKEDIDDFRRDYESRKNQVETMDKGFFNLPNDGETKPVFYIQLGSKLYFGFTPRLRLFYDKTICEGLDENQKNAGVDYCKSIFGYTPDSNNTQNNGDSGKKAGYKSRVAFMDALMVKGSGKEQEKKVSLVLGSPKPTSYLDYLTPKTDIDAVASYNNDFMLRGIKQYWLKKEVDSPSASKNEKVSSGFTPYTAGTGFKGRVRFDNLSEDELGMLLWSIQLEDNSNQNIGKGKPYGYGRVEVKVTGLKKLDFEKMYDSDSLSLKPYSDMDDCIDDYIRIAKDNMTGFIGRDVMSCPSVKHFFMMKDADNIPGNDKTRYMSLDSREYQNRVSKSVMLPTVEDVIDSKQIMVPDNKNRNSEKPGNGKNRSYGKNSGHKGNNVSSRETYDTVHHDTDSDSSNEMMSKILNAGFKTTKR